MQSSKFTASIPTLSEGEQKACEYTDSRGAPYVALSSSSVATEGAAAPAYGIPTVERAATAQPTAVDAGDAVRPWADLSGRRHTFSDSAYDNIAITPSDATDLTGVRAIYVGGAGNVVVEALGGGTATWAAVAGAILPVCPKYVKAATSATLLVGLK